MDRFISLAVGMKKQSELLSPYSIPSFHVSNESKSVAAVLHVSFTDSWVENKWCFSDVLHLQSIKSEPPPVASTSSTDLQRRQWFESSSSASPTNHSTGQTSVVYGGGGGVLQQTEDAMDHTQSASDAGASSSVVIDDDHRNGEHQPRAVQWQQLWSLASFRCVVQQPSDLLFAGRVN